jgi:hypothetical protein
LVAVVRGIDQMGDGVAIKVAIIPGGAEHHAKP